MPNPLSDKERVATLEAKVEAIMNLDERDRDWREEVIEKLTEIITNQTTFKDYQKHSEALITAHDKRITELENARSNLRSVLAFAVALGCAVAAFIAWITPIVTQVVTHHG